MKLPKATFESLWKEWSNLREFPNSVLDTHATLFPATFDLRFPPIHEKYKGTSLDYFLYATIAGRTLPVERGIELVLVTGQPVIKSAAALLNGAPVRQTSPPDEVIRRASQEDPLANAILVYHIAGLAYYFDKPLEIMAYKSRPKGLHPKWNIILLRDRSEGNFGFTTMADQKANRLSVSLMDMQLTDPTRLEAIKEELHTKYSDDMKSGLRYLNRQIQKYIKEQEAIGNF